MASYSAGVWGDCAPYGRRSGGRLHGDGDYVLHECGPESYHDEPARFIGALRVDNGKLNPGRLRWQRQVVLVHSSRDR